LKKLVEKLCSFKIKADETKLFCLAINAVLGFRFLQQKFNSFTRTKQNYMSLPTNNKKTNTQGKSQKSQAKGSKFIQGGSSSKPISSPKKVRTGGTRGS